MIYMPYLFVAPIQLVIVTVLLYHYIGLSGFAGVAILILLSPTQGKDAPTPTTTYTMPHISLFIYP
jgi:hypothetical protein